MPTYTLTSRVPASAEQLFAWHERPGAFHRLNPPFDPVTVLSRAGEGLGVDVRIELEAKVGPARVRWTSRHVASERPSGFVDEQERGPFSRWRHEHRFSDGELSDHIDWEAPLGLAGRLAHGPIGARLDRAFRFRHSRTAWDLERIAPHRGKGPLRIGLTGAGGLVGSAIGHFLDAAGHEVVPFSRKASAQGRYVRWDPGAGVLDPRDIEGLDAIIHLAGEPVSAPSGGGRAWSEAHKREILRSRVDGTSLLTSAIAASARRPKALLMASAVGFYGDRGDEVLEESAPRGLGFLADVVEAWEASARPAAEAGVRVAFLRLGLVLAADGGVLGSLLPMFRAGGGGPLGSGQQWQPWVALDDVVGAFHHALWDDGLSGVINVVAPAPERQTDFARCLGRTLGRPAFLPAPAPALRLALGREMVDELLLASQRVSPKALLDSGFRFGQPSLEGALQRELGVFPSQRS